MSWTEIGRWLKRALWVLSILNCNALAYGVRLFPDGDGGISLFYVFVGLIGWELAGTKKWWAA